MRSGPKITDAAQQLAESVIHKMFAADMASRKLGMQIVEVRPGYARVEMNVLPEMLNGHAICHGGLIFSLADSAFAFACNTHNFVTVAAGCSIEFLAPAHTGDHLVAGSGAITARASGRLRCDDKQSEWPAHRSISRPLP